MADNFREFAVEPHDAGKRLDVFLSSRVEGWSRSQIQDLIRRGLVTVGSRAARKGGEIVEASDSVSIRLERQEQRAAPENIPLAIVHEDEDLVVIDKPAGMVVHMGAGVRSGTLVNALLHRIGTLSATGGAMRPGIVHRLDKMTSGLVIVAKNDAAHRSLAAQFKSREIYKTYVALVHGRVAKDAGEIARPIGRDPVRRVRMKAGGIAPREAFTRYRVVKRFPHFTLLEAMPLTGRTHQIRVHLASIGHPVVGDTLYAAPGKLRLGGKEEPTLERTFLHAAALEFAHPRSGESSVFNSPLPAQLVEFLCRLTNDDR